MGTRHNMQYLQLKMSYTLSETALKKGDAIKYKCNGEVYVRMVKSVDTMHNEIKLTTEDGYNSFITVNQLETGEVLILDVLTERVDETVELSDNVPNCMDCSYNVLPPDYKPCDSCYHIPDRPNFSPKKTFKEE